MENRNLKIEDVKTALDGVENPDLLYLIDQLIRLEKNREDWWEKLPEDAQRSILLGLKEVEEGKVHSHADVMSEFNRRFIL